MIKGSNCREQLLSVVVRGAQQLHPNTEIKAVEPVFRELGDVKEVAFVLLGRKKVKCNKLNFKVKLAEGKSLPGFIMAPTGEEMLARWEVTRKGPGGPKKCVCSAARSGTSVNIVQTRLQPWQMEGWGCNLP